MHRRGVGRQPDAQSAPRQPHKDVAAKLDMPPLQPELRKFVDWVADYTLSPRGMVLRMTLRMGEQLGPERVRIGVRLAGPPPAAHDAGARAGAGNSSPTASRAPKAKPPSEAGVSVGVDRRPDRRRHAGGCWRCRPEPVARPPDPGYARAGFLARPGGGRRGAAQAVRKAAIP